MMLSGIQLASLLVGLSAVMSPTISGEELRLRDDLGAPVSGPVKVCFYKGLQTICLDGPPFAVPDEMLDFESLTAEGPRHGPVSVRHSDLDTSAISIPRKARLQIEGIQAGGDFSLSLYARDDRAFRKPTLRFEHVGALELWIPARAFVAALSDGAHAPDLQFVDARSGQKSFLAFHPRDGWSLLVRCLDAKAGAVSGALIGLTSPAAGSRALGLGSAKTAKDGLGLLNGISVPWATLSAAGEGFLALEMPATTSAIRTIGFRELQMLRGGNVRAAISISGEPGGGAACELVSMQGQDQPGTRIPKPVVLNRVLAGRDGVCETRRVKPGDYIFRITPPGAGNSEDEPVTVAEESTTQVEERLGLYEIRGMVQRGQDPAAGVFVVAINELDQVTSPTGRAVPPAWMHAETDSNGSYHGRVFRRGTYVVLATDKGDTVLAKREKVDVGGEGATVDFQLNSAEISGVVLDDHGDPVAGAWTQLKLIEPDGETFRPGASDEFGRFRFSLEGAANIELSAGKRGYRKSESFATAVLPEAEIPPVSLVLTKLDSVSGHVLGASGAPMAGVQVLAYGVSPGLPPVSAGGTETDAGGSFTVAAAPGGSSRLFVTGAQCPLQILDVANASDDLIIGCAEVASGLEVSIQAPSGKPEEFDSVHLVWNGRLIPRQVFLQHALSLGMSPVSDANGRLTIVGLPPGDYAVYLTSGSNEALIASGQKYGFVSDVYIDPMQTTQIETRLP